MPADHLGQGLELLRRAFDDELDFRCGFQLSLPPVMRLQTRYNIHASREMFLQNALRQVSRFFHARGGDEDDAGGDGHGVYNNVCIPGLVEGSVRAVVSRFEVSQAHGVMPTLFLICGLPGSGKTTLAKQLESERPALRLAPDEWMARIVGDGYDEARRAAVESVQWEPAQRALSLGVDVILESGFWSRNERNELRMRAAALGAKTKLYYLDVPLDELKRRITLRNAALPPDTFHVDIAQLNVWANQFEIPTPDELG